MDYVAECQQLVHCIYIFNVFFHLFALYTTFCFLASMSVLNAIKVYYKKTNPASFFKYFKFYFFRPLKTLEIIK